MVRDETMTAASCNRDAYQHGKTFRKSVLGGNTLVLFMTPSLKDEVVPVAITREKFEKGNLCTPSALRLFSMLKEVNKFMVKGAKLYESLEELRVCGWVSPYTLLLSGPAEDMKVVKKAWIKRYLKNPLGYFINDIGIIQDFVVELLPQSPFLSLKTALFDAISDLNNQTICPTKDNLREYLKKHYPELKLPDMKHVHECLSRLIRERRLYHNGQGYFVISNDHVLNEVKRLTTNGNSNAETLQSKPVKIEGFVVSSSDKTSSSPAVTECDVNSTPLNVSTIEVEVSSAESGFPSCLETKRVDTNTSNVLKSFFKRRAKIVTKTDEQNEKMTHKNVNFGNSSRDKVQNNMRTGNLSYRKGNLCIPSSMTHNHGTKTSEMHRATSSTKAWVSPDHRTSKVCNQVNVNHGSSDLSKIHGQNGKFGDKNACTGRNISFNLHRTRNESNKGHNFDALLACSSKHSPNLTRSLSLESMEAAHHETRFASMEYPVSADSKKGGHLERSHSFGVGCRKSGLKHICAGKGSVGDNDNHSNKLYAGVGTGMTSSPGVDDWTSGTTYEIDKNGNIDSADASTVKRSLEEPPPDLIFNYNNLRSSTGFHDKDLTGYTVHDLCSPAKSLSLAHELESELKMYETVNDQSKVLMEKSEYGCEKNPLSTHKGLTGNVHESENSITNPDNQRKLNSDTQNGQLHANIDINSNVKQYAGEQLPENEMVSCCKVNVLDAVSIHTTSISSGNPEVAQMTHIDESTKRNPGNCSSLLYEGKSSLKPMGMV